MLNLPTDLISARMESQLQEVHKCLASLPSRLTHIVSASNETGQRAHGVQKTSQGEVTWPATAWEFPMLCCAALLWWKQPGAWNCWLSHGRRPSWWLTAASTFSHAEMMAVDDNISSVSYKHIPACGFTHTDSQWVNTWVWLEERDTHIIKLFMWCPDRNPKTLTPSLSFASWISVSIWDPHCVITKRHDRILKSCPKRALKKSLIGKEMFLMRAYLHRRLQTLYWARLVLGTTYVEAAQKLNWSSYPSVDLKANKQLSKAFGETLQNEYVVM